MKKFISKVKKSCHSFMTGKSGFSLVELIVVIAIMAVMAAVLAPALLGYVERSRAQKDDSAMGEVTNAIQLSLADMDVYDELLPYAVKGNFSCYADGDASTNTDANKIITKSPDYWLFNDECRKLDETPYQPAGSMRGVTITLKPNGSAEYILKDGIINQTGDSSTVKGTITGKTLNDAPEVYNRLRSTVGDTIKVSSQTYRNSTYTIFISMGTTGGNQADKQDAIQVYGQYNGTNLPEVMTATGSATQDKGNAGSGNNGGGSGHPSQPTVVTSINYGDTIPEGMRIVRFGQCNNCGRCFIEPDETSCKDCGGTDYTITPAIWNAGDVIHDKSELIGCVNYIYYGENIYYPYIYWDESNWEMRGDDTYWETNMTLVSGQLLESAFGRNVKTTMVSGEVVDASGLIIPISPTYTSTDWMFWGNRNLTSAPIIPSNIKNVENMFEDCTSLSGTIIMDAMPTNYTNFLKNTQVTAVKMSNGSTHPMEAELLATK